MSMALLMGAVAWLSTGCLWSCTWMDLASVFWVVLVRKAGLSGLRRNVERLHLSLYRLLRWIGYFSISN